jgi:signal peptidase I
MLKELFEWLKAIAYALVIVFVFNLFFGITTVYNTSMVPTLVEGNMLFISKISGIERGDIITFETEIKLTAADIESLSPIKQIFVSENSQKNLIKRVIGIPGDKVVIDHGEVYVNDIKSDESYINTVTNGTVNIQSVPDEQYFVMGDNRAVSLDSRNEIIGLVDEDRIIGEAMMRFWPFFDFTIF